MVGLRHTKIMKSVSRKPKRKPGRPATGCDPVMTVRLRPDLIAEVDEWRANYEGMDRSGAIRMLLGRGLCASLKIDPHVEELVEVSRDGKRRKTYKKVAPPPPEPEEPEPPSPLVGRRNRRLPRRRPAPLSKDAVAAAVERAMARSKS